MVIFFIWALFNFGICFIYSTLSFVYKQFHCFHQRLSTSHTNITHALQGAVNGEKQRDIDDWTCCFYNFSNCHQRNIIITAVFAFVVQIKSNFYSHFLYIHLTGSLFVYIYMYIYSIINRDLFFCYFYNTVCL